MSAYTFECLRKHSKFIRGESNIILEKFKDEWDKAIGSFSDFYTKLETMPVSAMRNVKMVLSTRFINHIYSALTLAESGLLTDALICERAAIEALAGYKLVCVAPELSEDYIAKDFPKPAKVRDKLRSLGYVKEAKNVEKIYRDMSGFTHLSRDHERFSIKWEDGNNGILYVGGNCNKFGIAYIVEFMPALIYWYLMEVQV